MRETVKQEPKPCFGPGFVARPTVRPKENALTGQASEQGRNPGAEKIGVAQINDAAEVFAQSEFKQSTLEEN